MSEDLKRPAAALAPADLAPAPRPTVVLRDRVIAQLQDAFAHGTLEVEEFERRVTVAHQSEVGSEVTALVADLPASAQSLDAPAARTLLPSRDVKARGTIIAAMGGADRRGAWIVPRHLGVYTIMGGATLDFRDARLPEGEVEIQIGVLMGGVEIIVPPSLAVEANGAGIMGGFAHVDRAPAGVEPGGTVLRVNGFALMGGVNIEMRLPGESRRDARRRRRRDEKADRRADRKLVRRDR